MAIFQKAYKGYDGPVTPNFERTLVIFRYGLADVFRSRLFAGFFAICFLLPLALMCLLYVYHNIDLLLQFDVTEEDLNYIDGGIFAVTMQLPQLFLIFIMVMTIGPVMISPDMRNNAMPLYLSRPISKASYILGKLLVLLFLGSLISWVPALMLIGLQGILDGEGWFLDNLYIPVAATVTSLLWILVLSLLAFAVSSYVKWKAVARLVFFGVLFFFSVISEVIREIFGFGEVMNVSAAIQTLMVDLYRLEGSSQVDMEAVMPVGTAYGVVAVFIAAALVVLTRRIRAYQVVS